MPRLLKTAPGGAKRDADSRGIASTGQTGHGAGRFPPHRNPPRRHPVPFLMIKRFISLVLLDAVVTDARGNQILGLGKDDFIVKENGVVQPINSVEYFTSRKLLNATEKT